MGFLIVAIIIFALFQRRKYRRIYRGYKRDKWSRRWERMQSHKDATGESGRVANDKWDKWSCQWQDWERWANDARHQAAHVGQKVASKLEMAEAKLRREAERLRGGPAAPSDAAKSGNSADSQSSKTAGPERRGEAGQDPAPERDSDEELKAYKRARRRAAREAGFYIHLMWYGIVIGFLFLLNMFTSPFNWWWQWPAFGWGFGIVSHAAAVYGWDVIRQRVFEPAIQREVQREVTKEKEVMATEKQASLDELTASFAHEIRNPIAAAKSLVQQMGEDPTSQENVEYAKVALDELQRVEKSVSHLLKYAKEEDYSFDNFNLAAILDASLTQMRAKLEAKNVSISRNYIGGPTVRADADKLRQVFTNIIDNAIDAMESQHQRPPPRHHHPQQSIPAWRR